MKDLEKEREKEPPRSGVGDYFVVAAGTLTWPVSTAMARAIDASLDAEPMPKWVKFVDLTGARVRLRVRDIAYLAQCTVEQRTAERYFNRAIQGEYKADRSWSDE